MGLKFQIIPAEGKILEISYYNDQDEIINTITVELYDIECTEIMDTHIDYEYYGLTQYLELRSGKDYLRIQEIDKIDDSKSTLIF